MTNDDSTPNDDAKEQVIQAHKMGSDVTVGCTPNEELRELVDKWRYSQVNQTLPRSGLTSEGEVFKQCADELEKAIEESVQR